MRRRAWAREALSLILALLGFAAFTACIPSCNMPVGQRDQPRQGEWVRDPKDGSLHQVGQPARAPEDPLKPHSPALIPAPQPAAQPPSAPDDPLQPLLPVPAPVERP